MKSNKSKNFFHEITFLAVLNFFPVQKLIFGQLWNSKKWNLAKKFFREIDLFDFTIFFGLDFLTFWPTVVTVYVKKPRGVGTLVSTVPLSVIISFHLWSINVSTNSQGTPFFNGKLILHDPPGMGNGNRGLARPFNPGNVLANTSNNAGGFLMTSPPSKLGAIPKKMPSPAAQVHTYYTI